MTNAVVALLLAAALSGEGAPVMAAAASPVSAASPVPAGEQAVDPYARSPQNAGATPVAGAAVFNAFHGQAGVGRIASSFVDRNEADPRIRDIFAAADTVRLKRTLAEQFCYLLNGGCTYTGRDMREAHRGQGLQNADFNAVVENLQAAMDREGVPFRAQNVLLAKLAPMQRTVVERKSPAILKRWGRRLASLQGAAAPPEPRP